MTPSGVHDNNKGRPPKYGEPTVMFRQRVPASAVEEIKKYIDDYLKKNYPKKQPKKPR